MKQPHWFHQLLQRVLDLSGASLGLLLTWPVLAPVALAVRLSSPGPVLFRQPRLGRNGRPFQLLKFRSMYVNAPDLRNPDGSTFSSSQDPRVTPVGRFLRQTSLDELPQLINVLRGQMSLVGPRPDRLDQIQYYTERDKRKLLVRPGITGLAQIHGRNAIPWERRRALDVEYVERQSLWLDLSILLKTVPLVLLRRNIHANGADSLCQSPR